MALGSIQATVRLATSDADREAAFQLRYELYVGLQGLFRDEADHNRRWLTDAEDAHSHMILAELDGGLVGTIRVTSGADAPFSPTLRATYDMERFRGVVDERDIVVTTRLLVREELRGGIIAFQLIWKALEFVATRGADLMLCNCEPHLVNRYAKFGFRPYGKLYNHVTNGLLVPQAVVAGDFAYLERIESPMIGALRLRKRPIENLDAILSRIGTDTAVVSQDSCDADDYLTAVSDRLREAGQGIRNILKEISREEAFVLLAKSHILTCRPGDLVIGQGHVSRTLYILLAGSLNVEDCGRVVTTIEEHGSIVGELAFFTAGKRLNDVVAGKDGARVLAFSDRVLREIISSHGPVAAKFLHFAATELCKKLQGRPLAAPPP